MTALITIDSTYARKLNAKNKGMAIIRNIPFQAPRTWLLPPCNGKRAVDCAEKFSHNKRVESESIENFQNLKSTHKMRNVRKK